MRNLMTFSPQIKEDEIGGASSTHGVKKRNKLRVLVGELGGK